MGAASQMGVMSHTPIMVLQPRTVQKSQILSFIRGYFVYFCCCDLLFSPLQNMIDKHININVTLCAFANIPDTEKMIIFIVKGVKVFEKIKIIAFSTIARHRVSTQDGLYLLVEIRHELGAGPKMLLILPYIWFSNLNINRISTRMQFKYHILVKEV